jgi:glutamine cyclotransferase
MRRQWTPWVVALAALLLLSPPSGGAVAGGAGGEPAPVATVAVVGSWPHDPQAFTEGLVFHDGVFYEGTGLNGESTVRRVDPETGTVQGQYALPAAYFGEGVTLFGGKLIQLTWQSHTGFVYDLTCLCPEREFTYAGEGWGLTHDGESLIMSDGTNRLRFLNPATFAVVRTVAVHDAGRPVRNLNELEYVRGEIYANVWPTDRIARIDPASGRVLGWLDLAGLLPAEDRVGRIDVLNGIAYDTATDRLFVTGKWWPRLFAIQVR